jgi:metal-sulfur cluster biosynthetic enzyme
MSPRMSEAEVIAKIREKANEIHDPCGLAQGAAIGLVDMGLIRCLTARPDSDGHWTVDLTLRFTSPGCLYFSYFEDRLNAAAAIEGIELKIRWDDRFDWTPNEMASGARRKLPSVHFQRHAIFEE